MPDDCKIDWGTQYGTFEGDSNQKIGEDAPRLSIEGGALGKCNTSVVGGRRFSYDLNQTGSISFIGNGFSDGGGERMSFLSNVTISD